MGIKELLGIVIVSVLGSLWWVIKGKQSAEVLKDNQEEQKKLLEKDKEIGKLKLQDELFKLKEGLEAQQKEVLKAKPVDPSDFS